MGNSGFIKLRRGLDEHLPGIDGDALKLYVRLLFRADWRKGKNHGLAEVKLGEIAASFNWSRDTLTRKLAELEGRYISVESHGNQFTQSAIRILNYDGAFRKKAESSNEAFRKDAESNDEHSANLRGGVRKSAEGSPQNCGKHSGNAHESTEVKPSEEGLRKQEVVVGKNVIPENESMYDPTDRHFSPSGNFWKKLAIYKLSEEYRPFVEFLKAEMKQPAENATLIAVIKSVMDFAGQHDFRYPPELYGILKRLRADSPRELYYTKDELYAFRAERRRKEESRRKRAEELISKSWAGTLTPEEERELAATGR